jgi:hypothetical protein
MNWQTFCKMANLMASACKICQRKQLPIKSINSQKYSVIQDKGRRVQTDLVYVYFVNTEGLNVYAANFSKGKEVVLVQMPAAFPSTDDSLIHWCRRQTCPLGQVTTLSPKTDDSLVLWHRREP